jgi:hypothetical protein
LRHDPVPVGQSSYLSCVPTMTIEAVTLRYSPNIGQLHKLRADPSEGARWESSYGKEAETAQQGI